MSVGVMKDYKLKQRNLRASHTLGSRVLFFRVAETGTPKHRDVSGIMHDVHCSKMGHGSQTW